MYNPESQDLFFLQHSAQYIARCPISLEKIKYEPFHGRVLFKTPKYNDYFKENFKAFDVLDFIAEVTAHIPPKSKQYGFSMFFDRKKHLFL
ncbi:MAG: transposase [Spirochaetales bacterium]|nr:transposase [Spirochaetales bacterium]